MTNEIMDAANIAYQDGFVTLPFPPDKLVIRALFALIQSKFDELIGAASGKIIGKALASGLAGDLNWPAGTIGYVYGDTSGNNGAYTKSGDVGTGVWTRIGPLPDADTSDLLARANQVLLPSRELVISGTNLFIPSMFYWIAGAGQQGVPASGGSGQNPAPLYWKVAIQQSSTLVRWYYFSRSLAAAGSNPIVVVEATADPKTTTAGLDLIAFSINGQVTTYLPIVGGGSTGGATNQWLTGKYPDACEYFFGNANTVAANAALQAFGFDRAVSNATSSDIYYGASLRDRVSEHSSIFARIYLYQPTPSDVTTARIALWDGTTFTGNLFFSKEEQVDSHTSVWTCRSKIPAGVSADRFLIGFDQGTARDWQIAGGQLATANHYIGFVDREDYPPISQINYRPLYGHDMWMIGGRPQQLYLENLVGERNDDAPILRGGFMSVKTTDAGYPHVKEGWPQVEINPDKCGSVGRIEIRPAGVRGTVDVRYSTPMNCRIAGPSTATKKILFVGDSLTNRKMVRCVDAVVRSTGITPTWLGTIPGADGTTDFYNDTTGLPGEGREGFEYGDYIGKVTGRGTPVTNFSSYMAAAKVSKIAQLPFLRASTGGDPSDRVFNGLIFDMNYYLTGTGQADPDIVIFGLLTNDFIVRDAATAAANVADGIRVSFQQTRARLPSAKIGWWAPTHSVSNNNKLFGNHYSVVKAGIEAVRALGDANAFVVPVWAHQSSQIGYQLDPSFSPGVAYAIRAGIYDPIHFNIGDAPLRQQAAETLAAFIANS